MSSKVSKIQPLRSSVLTVSSIDSMDNVNSNNNLILQPLEDSPLFQQHRKKPRRQSYSGPSSSSSNNKSSFNSSNNNTDNNPHLKYARTLGRVSEARTQTALLSSPNVRSRAKSFSSGDNGHSSNNNNNNNNNDYYSNNNGTNSGNNSRNGSRRPSVQPNNSNNNNNSTGNLSRANSQKLFTSRKKRVTFRQPLVDDKMDFEASQRFSRSYTGSNMSGSGGFFGFHSRNASQSKLNVEATDDSLSSVSDENSGSNNTNTNAKNSHRTKHSNKTCGKNQPKTNNSARKIWLQWIGLYWIFPSKNNVHNYLDNNNNSTTTINANNNINDNNSNYVNSNNNSNASSPTLSTFISDFALPPIALETGKNNKNSNDNTDNNANNINNINDNNSNNNNSTAPNTPSSSTSSSLLFFSHWMSKPKD